MANDGAVARLSGRFPPGTKVGLYRGHIDAVPRDDKLAAAFKTATVSDGGTVEFRGLDDGERLFIAGLVTDDVPRPGERVPQTNWRYVAIHASIPVAERKPDSPEKIRTALASTLSAHELEPDRTTVGARDSRSKSRGGQPFAHEQTGKPTPGGAPAEPVPHLRQEDARDLEQRSATFTGQATPVDPGEQVPKPRQEGAVDLEQRSATGAGELTPVEQPKQQSKPAAKKQARKASAPARKRPARTEAQKAARRKRDAAKRK